MTRSSTPATKPSTDPFCEALRLAEQQIARIQMAALAIKHDVRRGQHTRDRVLITKAREAAEIAAAESDNLFRWLAEIERDIPVPQPATTATARPTSKER
jgi:hypothetical protein